MTLAFFNDVARQAFDSLFDSLLLMLAMAPLPARARGGVKRWGLLAAVIVVSSVIRGLEVNLYLDMLMRMGVFFLFLFWIKDISPLKAVYHIVMFYLIVELCNTVASFCSNYILGEGIGRILLPGTSFTSTFFMVLKIVAVVPLRILTKRQGIRRPEKSQLFFLMFPLVLFLYLRHLNFSLWSGKASVEDSLVILAIVSSVICYGMVLLSDAQIAFIQNRNELQGMALLLEKERQYYEERARNSEEIRKLAHDMKNHLRTIRKLSHEREVQEYVTSIIGEVNSHEMLYQTGNGALDIILNDKFHACQEKAIRLTPYMDAGGLDFIRPADLSVIFGNLLDNAIEAVEKIREPERREIRLKISHKGRFFVIRVENPFSEPPLRIAGNRFRTGKQDRHFHGFGLGNVQQVVDGYCGQMSTDMDADIFRVTVLIPEPGDSYSGNPAS
jgi:sensor histidine kinase YesM